jgi:tRNA 2-thiouridine synthesizing protein C
MNLVIFRQAPYGTSYAAEGVRVLSSLGAFEVECSVLFMDDGVFSLVKDQHPEELEMKPLVKGIESILQGGITVFVSGESLTERQVNPGEILEGAIIVNNADIRNMLDESDIILTF